MQQEEETPQTICILGGKATGSPDKARAGGSHSHAGWEGGLRMFSEWRRVQGLWGRVRWSHFRMPGPGGTGKRMAPRLCWEAAHCTNAAGLWVLGQSSSWEEALLRGEERSNENTHLGRPKWNKPLNSISFSSVPACPGRLRRSGNIRADMQPYLHPAPALSKSTPPGGYRPRTHRKIFISSLLRLP